MKIVSEYPSSVAISCIAPSGEQSVVNAEVVAAAAVAGEDADDPNGDGMRRVGHGRRP